MQCMHTYINIPMDNITSIFKNIYCIYKHPHKIISKHISYIYAYLATHMHTYIFERIGGMKRNETKMQAYGSGDIKGEVV